MTRAAFQSLSPSFSLLNDRSQKSHGVVRVFWHVSAGAPSPARRRRGPGRAEMGTACRLCRRRTLGTRRRHPVVAISRQHHHRALRRLVAAAQARLLTPIVEPVGDTSLISDTMWAFVLHANARSGTSLIPRLEGTPHQFTPRTLDALVAARIAHVEIVLDPKRLHAGGRSAPTHLRRAWMAHDKLKATGVESRLVFPLSSANVRFLVPTIDALAGIGAYQVHIAGDAGVEDGDARGARTLLDGVLRSMDRFQYWRARGAPFQWSASHAGYRHVCRQLGLDDSAALRGIREPAAFVLAVRCDGSVWRVGDRPAALGTIRSRPFAAMLEDAERGA